MYMLLVVLLAKLLDPVVVILAFAAAVACRQWWQIVICAFGIGIVLELVLFSIQTVRTFNLISFLVGVAAAGLWASAVFGIKRYKAARGARNL